MVTCSVPPDASSEELDRQRRVVDQSMSMQSRLRDISRIIGTTLVTLVLLGSVVSLGFAFAAGDEAVVIFGVSAARTTWLGYLAMVTFGLTLVELILDPRGIARKREQAVRALASLKAEYRAH